MIHKNGKLKKSTEDTYYVWNYQVVKLKYQELPDANKQSTKDLWAAKYFLKRKKPGIEK